MVLLFLLVTFNFDLRHWPTVVLSWHSCQTLIRYRSFCIESYCPNPRNTHTHTHTADRLLYPAAKVVEKACLLHVVVICYTHSTRRVHNRWGNASSSFVTNDSSLHQPARVSAYGYWPGYFLELRSHRWDWTELVKLGFWTVYYSKTKYVSKQVNAHKG